MPIRRFFLIAFALCLAARLPAASAAIEQWGIFEATLTGPATGNPFVDVSLSATFSQGERSLEVPGFYDGDGTYRIRFMPDTPGEWRYTTRSNQRELDARAGGFTATSPGPNNHGPVRVHRTFHFAYADGTPYRQLGTTAYSWIHRTDAQEEQTLHTLAAAPFNKIRMCVFPQNQPEARQRFFPFVRGTDTRWDTSRFEPAFFRHLELRVGQLRDLGIEADLIMFHPYGGRFRFSAMDAASDGRYIRYLVARLGAYRNVWWSLANEYDFIREKQESDWDRMLELVQKTDPFQRLRSIHNGTLIYNHTRSTVTHVSIQNGAAVLDPERALLYRDVYRKPIVYDEVKYEGDSQARWGQLSGEAMVLRFWNGLIAGTYVGHGEIYRPTGDSRDTWLAGGGVLRGTAIPRLAFLRRIMDEMPAGGIDPIDKWQERRTGGRAGEFYLTYFGETAPAAWPFILYKDGPNAGDRYAAEIIDTWNMTITPVPGTFVASRRDEYTWEDAEKKTIALPGRPYLALRIRRLP